MSPVTFRQLYEYYFEGIQFLQYIFNILEHSHTEFANTKGKEEFGRVGKA